MNFPAEIRLTDYLALPSIAFAFALEDNQLGDPRSLGGPVSRL
jgi:hypothetical protein